MENYSKGEVKEVEEAPVFSLGSKDVHMRVNSGSKIRNLMGYAMKKIKEPDTKQMCWSGSGKAITKAVSCAEIMKRKIKGLHQITEIRKRRIEEYWEPKLEGLERLKVNRDIPAISILLSKEPLDKDRPGYQAPGSFDEFWKEVVQKDKSRVSNRGQKKKPGPRNVLLEGAKGTNSEGPRSKTNTNNENKKRKFENEKKHDWKSKADRKGQSEKVSSNKTVSDNQSNSGKGKQPIAKMDKSSVGSREKCEKSQVKTTDAMETDT